jgi:hypothetical protein
MFALPIIMHCQYEPYYYGQFIVYLQYFKQSNLIFHGFIFLIYQHLIIDLPILITFFKFFK